MAGCEQAFPADRDQPAARMAAVAVLTAATGLAATGMTGPAAAVAPAAAAGWSAVPAQTVSGQNFILNAVAEPAAGDVWVAGYHWEDVGGATEFRTLAEHFDGTRFTVVPTPDREAAPATDFLQGLAGTSATDLWAVGDSAPPGTLDQTLIEHWDGMSWSIVPSPDPGTSGDILQAVAAVSASDAWAVGARQDTGVFYQRPMALHWDGTAWAAVPVPEPRGCTGHSYLTSVSAPGATDVWAAGWCGSGGSTPQQGYIEHWPLSLRYAGNRWRAVRVPVTFGFLNGLTAGAGAQLWAAGSRPGSQGFDVPVIITRHA